MLHSLKIYMLVFICYSVVEIEIDQCVGETPHRAQPHSAIFLNRVQMRVVTHAFQRVRSRIPRETLFLAPSDAAHNVPALRAILPRHRRG